MQIDYLQELALREEEDDFDFGFSNKQSKLLQQPILNTPTSTLFEPMTEQYIQQEIGLAYKKKDKQKSEDIKPPNIWMLNDTKNNFENFIKNKEYSFQLLSLHPYFRGKFEQNDIRVVSKSYDQREQSLFIIRMLSVCSLYFGSEHLLKTRALFGLTHSKKISVVFFKYYLIPKILTKTVDSFVFFPELQQKTDLIYKKYNLDQEIKSNPLYKKAYDDFLLYFKNL